MKKMFFVIVALLCVTQIVSATEIKDATLKEQGKQNEASTIAWLRSDNPDADLITMSVSQFNKGFKVCLEEFNKKYKTFREITDDVINDEIIPELYTADLDKNKLYTVSYWDVVNKKWGRWTRKAKPGETGLFYPGWEEPVLSVYCWNFGYPSSAPVAPVIKPAERQEQKQEYVFIPGTTKVIEHGTDTVKETFSTYKEVERNSYNKINNQTFTLEAQQASYVQSGCNHQQVQQCNHQVQQASCNHQQVQQDCGCREDYSCQGHKKVKNKKPFFNTTGGKLLLFGAGVVTGAVLENNTNINWPGGRRTLQGQVVTHGPLNLLPVSNPVIFTHGPLN
ncbi:MAG TPA: hypothetical protein PLQ20_00900 [Candidatus Paceibacterota bacterium]|nr:hypothetical protein [Candidatus Paceibacterota bacterium]